MRWYGMEWNDDQSNQSFVSTLLHLPCFQIQKKKKNRNARNRNLHVYSNSDYYIEQS